MRTNIVQIWRPAPLPYLFLTGEGIVLENVSVSYIQNLKTIS